MHLSRRASKHVNWRAGIEISGLSDLMDTEQEIVLTLWQSERRVLGLPTRHDKIDTKTDTQTQTPPLCLTKILRGFPSCWGCDPV